MKTNKYLALSALGFFLTGCTGVMTKNQAALVGAAVCGAGERGLVLRHHPGTPRQEEP